jgi:hypothetical protein
MMPKRYYTFMIDPELIDALKEAKELTGLSEGAQIRQALKVWFAKRGGKVKKSPPRPRARTRGRS